MKLHTAGRIEAHRFAWRKRSIPSGRASMVGITMIGTRCRFSTRLRAEVPIFWSAGSLQSGVGPAK
jgi:hypothetical protein